ncbi:SIMPL domain-containing protein [Halolamina sediminis]|jgi:uncharacterized protein YggE|uniref:SIMPL domain-containing protein n=1 Tax=Halolamina sediminis TaxID=1480675 RepID=UPI0006B45AD7|nr:SIMPL domain-containing protein [Halolamina sediminis]
MSSPTVEVTGKAAVETEPEYAVFVVEIEGYGETVSGAQRRVEDRLAELDRELPDAVDDAADSVTGRSVTSADELFDPDCDDPYVASATVELRCDGLPGDDVANAVAAAGGTVSRTEPRVTESRREALREELLGAATENAREQAEIVANADGHTLGSVVSLATKESMGFDSIVEEALATEVSAGVPAGQVEFTASVDATYELE